QKRLAIGLHLDLAERPDNALRQHGLDEEVLLQRQPLAIRATQCAEYLIAPGRKVTPPPRLHDRFHIGDGADLLRKPAGAMKAERIAPSDVDVAYFAVEDAQPLPRMPVFCADAGYRGCCRRHGVSPVLIAA